MRVIIPLTLISLSGSIAVCLAAGAEPTTVVEAEYAFAASAKPLGTRGAFLKYLANDSILCTPAPVNGITSTTAGKPNSDTLEWYPTHSHTAGSGDLGYTTGPWTYRTADGKTEVHGTFLSVWRKQPDGAWRVVVDCGVSHPKPAVVPAGLKAPAPNSYAGVDVPDLRAWKDPVAAADERFTAAAAKGPAAALKEFAAADVRVMAKGVSTVSGIEPAQALVNGQKLGTRWQHVFAGQSNDGMLGYTWGYIGADASEQPAAAYVNVWRRANAAAPWQIVALSLQTLPGKP
jgi:hypothetical protein